MILGTTTVKRTESIAEQPAVSVMMAVMVAPDAAINSNVVQPGHATPLYSSQSIDPIASPGRFVERVILTESPSFTVKAFPKSTVTRSGSVIVYTCVYVHPFASVTVRLYDPGESEVIIVPDPTAGSQLYMKPGVPRSTSTTDKEPSSSPKHVTFF